MKSHFMTIVLMFIVGLGTPVASGQQASPVPLPNSPTGELGIILDGHRWVMCVPADGPYENLEICAYDLKTSEILDCQEARTDVILPNAVTATPRPDLCRPFFVVGKATILDQEVGEVSSYSLASGPYQLSADLTGDGIVGGPDFIVMSNNWLSYGKPSFLCLSSAFGSKTEIDTVPRTSMPICERPFKQTLMQRKPLGLVGYWQFNEGIGTEVIDATGNSPGVINGATWVPGITGMALSFDGIDDEVVLANTPALDIQGTSITLTAWVQPQTKGVRAGSRIISKRTDVQGDDVYAMFTYRHLFKFRLKLSTARDLVTQDKFTIGEWIHVAMVYDGTDRHIYLNGNLNSTSQNKSGPVESSNMPVYLGARQEEGRRFTGVIDEVRIYNRALNAEEVAVLATRNVSGP